MAGVSGRAVAAERQRKESDDPDSFKEVYDEALDIRDETGDRSKFQEHLTENGCKVAAGEETVSLPSKDGGGVSAQDIPEGKFSWQWDLTIPYGDDFQHLDGVYYLSVGWEFDIGTGDGSTLYTGTAHDDGIGAHWATNDYNAPEDMSFGRYVEKEDHFAGGIAGGYNVYDHNMEAADNMQDTFGSYMSCRLTEYDDNDGSGQDPSDLDIIMDYEHTYGGLGVSGISIGTGGLSVVTKFQTNTWYKSKTIDASDAEYQTIM